MKFNLHVKCESQSKFRHQVGIFPLPLIIGFRSSPRANITLSGKKRRKLLKQLQNQQKSSPEGDRFPFFGRRCHRNKISK